MNEPKRLDGSKSLSTTVATAFGLLSVISLLLMSSFLIYLNFQSEKDLILSRQRLIATNAAVDVSNFVEQMFRVLETAVQIGVNEVVTVDGQEKSLLPDQLLGTQSAFREVALLDEGGQVRALASRLSPLEAGRSPYYTNPNLTGQAWRRSRFISPVYLDETTGEPLIVLAVPIYSRLQEFQGNLAAEVNLKFMWDLISQLQVGQAGRAYVVDRHGTLIAFSDSARVLKGENLSYLPEVAEFMERNDLAAELEETILPISTGINQTKVVATYMPLGQPDWAVIVELPAAEAYQDILSNMTLSVGILILVVLGAVMTGLLTARRLAAPLLDLTQSATRITAGELNLAAVVKGPREIVRLADAFNSMTAQLRDLIDSLERRVAERTHRLRLVATISEQFNAILDFEQLLLELVHQVRENFYYHQTAIYLVSEDRQTLVLKASAREFGYQTKPDEQTIHVGAPLRLVAQAFRNREIVTASNMREGERWLAALPAEESYVEMAVPIIVAGVVVGILDVQQNERDGLDEGDANLLRSLANQVSVALTNARLFTETMQAKDEAEEAREATEKVNQRLEERIWQTSGQAELSDQIRGEQDLTSLADSVIQHLCRYLGAQIGALYVVEDERLLLAGKFAYSLDQPGESFQLGEGLIGQAAIERQPLIIQDVPENYIRVRSGIGETPPKQIMIFPFIYEDRLLGVIELGRLTLFSRAEAEFVRTALKSIAITFNTVRIRLQIQQLLEETQRQAEELQLQGVELQTANEGLEAQTASLRLSETRLMEKQSELEATNTELEEKARALEESSQALHEQRSLLDQQNQELSLAQQDLLQQTQALALANQYKSEFLSNMSHELRTPLNSLLILSRVLAENENGNLTAEQLEFVNIIYGAGSDLLTLINDILDLAKVESGQLLVNFDAVALTDLVSSMMSQFNHIATEKGLDFRVSLAEELPQIIETDEQRLKQIIRNLLSNAFKFTHAGEVTFHITRPTDPFILQWLELEAAAAIAFQVRDTGIGISAEQQKIIFEAFKQADSGMSRQYGGTGLGLTISRELAARLGGQIELDSELGRGSTFTLYLPAKKKEAAADGLEDRDETAATAFEVDEAVFETESLPEYSSVGGIPFKGDGVFVGKKVLVADDDVRNAFALSKILADKGIDVRVAGNGQKALEMLAAEPVDLVLMDIMMPIMDGYEATRRIRLQAQWQALPILALTAKAMKGDREKCLEAGANDYLSKPIDVDQLYAMLQNWLYR